MNFKRDDEDWLSGNGIAPYDKAELHQARDAVVAFAPLFADVMQRFVDVINGVAPVMQHLTDAIITYEVDEFCEAATLLDPNAPVSGDEETTSG